MNAHDKLLLAKKAREIASGQEDAIVNLPGGSDHITRDEVRIIVAAAFEGFAQSLERDA